MSPTERIARIRALIRRGLSYSKGSLAILGVGAAIAVGVAKNTKPVYRAECTVFAKARIRTDDRDDGSPSPDQIVRQGARLKDMLTTRGRLEMAIKTYHLYPETVANRSMLEAVEDMKPHVGFRSLEGALYVISFDGNQPDVVQKVTQYLADTLIDDYAAGDLDDLRRDANFLEKEENSSLEGLEESTRALTVFLAAHPEFALEAKQAAAPFGPSPTSGIPLMPSVAAGAQGPGAGDAELAALYREHGRLDGEAHVGGGSRAGGIVAGKSLDESLAQAQAAVDAAAKRVAESQVDLASKSNLTEDHPDMRAARMAADAAARQLHEAKSSYANLKQLKEGGAAPVDPAIVSPDVAAKLRQVNAQIAARRAQLARSQGPTRPANPEVTAVVELETEWQRLLRALSEARSHHDDLKLRAQRAKLALEAAHVQANEQMAVVDPAVRPTHPSKGGRTNTALAGLAASLMLSLAYASMRVAVDDRLIDADDIEALGLLPVLCVVPKLAPAGSARSLEADASNRKVDGDAAA
jgi:uncharacterized protein involved in exopolysaccharide biosynthesis